MSEFEQYGLTPYRKTSRAGKKLVNDRYECRGTLSNGQFSRVKCLFDLESKELLAVKKYSVGLLRKKVTPVKLSTGQIIKKTPVDDIHRELKALRAIDHPGCLALRQVLYSKPPQEKLYIVTNYCAGGQLLQWQASQACFLDKFKFSSELQLAIGVMRGCLEALRYLKSKRIAHRDIKPQNILLAQPLAPVIVDFGCSELLAEKQLLVGSAGTYHFMSPECLDCPTPEGYDGHAADVWSMGVVFYAMATRKLPFFDENLMRLMDKITNDQPDYKPVEEGVAQLLRRMLEKDWRKRARVEDCLLHPYFYRKGQ